METKAEYKTNSGLGGGNPIWDLFSGWRDCHKLMRIAHWLVAEAAEVIESDGCNWKIVIHGGPGKDIKTVIEKYANLE